jgi:hypothetical protein
MMAGKKRQYRKKKRQQEEERRRREQESRAEVTDNWDIVDTDERRPSDYWAIREMREEYCKELYDTPHC